jgi:Fic family protein
MNNVLDENDNLVQIGKYRNTLRGIRGVKHSRPDQIKQDIIDLNKWYDDKTRSKLQPLEIAAIYHHRFEQIHPFHDGNGRVGRALLDLILKRNGFPPIYITRKERSVYLSALQEADYSNFQPLVDLLIARMVWTFNKLLIKTDIYSKIKSEEFGRLFGKLVDNDLYKMYMQEMKIVEEPED